MSFSFGPTFCKAKPLYKIFDTDKKNMSFSFGPTFYKAKPLYKFFHTDKKV